MKINFRSLVLIFILIAGTAYLLFPSRRQILSDGKITQTTPVNFENLTISPQTVPGQPRVDISTTKGLFTLALSPSHPNFAQILAKLSADEYSGQSVSLLLSETISTGLANVYSGQQVIDSILPGDKILSTDILTK